MVMLPIYTFSNTLHPSVTKTRFKTLPPKATPENETWNAWRSACLWGQSQWNACNKVKLTNAITLLDWKVLLKQSLIKYLTLRFLSWPNRRSGTDYHTRSHTVCEFQSTLSFPQRQTMSNLAVQLPLVVERLQRFQVLFKDGNVWLQEGLSIGLKHNALGEVEKTES